MAGDRFSDVRLVLRELLERWDAGLARNPTERRIVLRASQERAGSLGPSPVSGDDGEAPPLASVRALFRDVEVAVDAGTCPAGGDDDDVAEIDDVADADFYADAFEVID